MNQRGKFKWQLLELPDGITTSNGNWYHITSEGINDYLPGLLKKYSLEKIIREADAWLRSADILALLLFYLLAILNINPFLSATVAVFFYLFWFFNTSAFVNAGISPFIRLIQSDAFIYSVSGIVLIYLSYVDLIAMWVGAGLLFLFKVGLLRLAINFVVSKKPDSNTQMPDRILNMLLIRYGMKEGILTGNIKEMQDEFIRVINYHKTKKNK